MIKVKDKKELIEIITERVNINVNSDLTDLDVSDITNMSKIFYKSSFNGDISNWDVSNVISMSKMFSESSFNGDISNWDVSNVISMSKMFSESSFNGDISNWDVSNVKSMYGMFYRSSFNQNISNWLIKGVINIEYMFVGSKFKGDISNWELNTLGRNIDIPYKILKTFIEGIPIIIEGQSYDSVKKRLESMRAKLSQDLKRNDEYYSLSKEEFRTLKLYLSWLDGTPAKASLKNCYKPPGHKLLKTKSDFNVYKLKKQKENRLLGRFSSLITQK